MADGSNGTKKTARKKKKKGGPLGALVKLVFGVGVLALVLLVAAVVIAPAVVGAQGRPIVENLVNESIAGRAEVGGLRLGWFGEQKVTGARLFDPEGGEIGSFDVAVPLGLLDAVRGIRAGSLDIGEIRVSGRAEIVKGPDGELNIARALEPAGGPAAEADAGDATGTGGADGGAEPAGAITLPAEFAVRVDTVDVVYRDDSLAEQLNADIGVIELDGLTTRIAVKKGEPIDFEGSVRVAYGASGAESADRTAARVEFSGRLDDAVSSAGAVEAERATLSLTASAEGLPSELVDAVFGFDGIVAAAAGESIDLTLDGAGLPHVGGTLSLGGGSASARLEGGEFRVTGRDETLPGGGVLRKRELTLASPEAKLSVLEIDESFAVELTEFLPAFGSISKAAGEERPSSITVTELVLPVAGYESDELLRAFRMVSRVDPGEIRYGFSGQLAGILQTGLAPFTDEFSELSGLGGTRIVPFGVSSIDGVATYEGMSVPLGEFLLELKGEQDLVTGRQEHRLVMPAGALAREALGDGVAADFLGEIQVPVVAAADRGEELSWELDLDIDRLVRQALENEGRDRVKEQLDKLGEDLLDGIGDGPAQDGLKDLFNSVGGQVLDGALGGEGEAGAAPAEDPGETIRRVGGSLLEGLIREELGGSTGQRLGELLAGSGGREAPATSPLPMPGDSSDERRRRAVEGLIGGLLGGDGDREARRGGTRGLLDAVAPRVAEAVGAEEPGGPDAAAEAGGDTPRSEQASEPEPEPEEDRPIEEELIEEGVRTLFDLLGGN